MMSYGTGTRCDKGGTGKNEPDIGVSFPPRREPLYWMDETSGVVAKAVKEYLQGEGVLADSTVQVLRAYFGQWIRATVWDENPYATDESRAILAELRRDVTTLKTRAEFWQWIARATEAGLDPL